MSQIFSPKTILVVSSGDGTGLNFVRSLGLAGGYRTIGVDFSAEDYHISETDERYLVQWSGAGDLITQINEIACRESADLVYAADTGFALSAISENRHLLAVPTLLPDLEDHLRMEDKWATYLALRERDIETPDSVLVRGRQDLESLFAQHPALWLRRRRGSGGSGSLATSSLALAEAWVGENDGWGEFTAAERLTSRMATFSGLWHEGQLVLSQLRERLSWKYSALSPTGVTGVTGTQRTMWDESLHALAVRCVRAVSARPHGIIGVDFTYNRQGAPLPTEVQPARFYSSIHFLARLNVNFPDIYCRLALGEKICDDPVVNPIRRHHYWVKSVDVLPKLLTSDEFTDG